MFRTCLHSTEFRRTESGVSQGDPGPYLEKTLGRLSFQLDTMPRGGTSAITQGVQAEG